MANDQYYFYRCRKCNSVITRLDLNAALEHGPSVCPCGSGMIGPTNPLGMEWLRPGVLKMTALKLLGRLEGAPAPTLPLPIPAGIRSVPALANEEKWVSGEDE